MDAASFDALFEGTLRPELALTEQQRRIQALLSCKRGCCPDTVTAKRWTRLVSASCWFCFGSRRQPRQSRRKSPITGLERNKQRFRLHGTSSPLAHGVTSTTETMCARRATTSSTTSPTISATRPTSFLANMGATLPHNLSSSPLHFRSARRCARCSVDRGSTVTSVVCQSRRHEMLHNTSHFVPWCPISSTITHVSDQAQAERETFRLAFREEIVLWSLPRYRSEQKASVIWVPVC